MLAAISIQILASCSTGWPLQQRQTRPPECPLAECLDKLTGPTPFVGVLAQKDRQPTRTCAQSVVLAADALATLRLERGLRAELIQCLRDHNKDVGELNNAKADR